MIRFIRRLFLLPFNFSWLLFPIFFIYTQKISIFSDQKIKYWVLFPGILSFVLQLIIYFLPHSTKLLIAESYWHEIVFTILGIFYSWGIGIWNLKLLAQHKTEVQNTFSQIERKVLEWVRIFLIYSLVSSLLIHILYYISPDNYNFKIIFSIFDLIAIYWVSVNGVIQQNVLSIIVKNESGLPIQAYLGIEHNQIKNENYDDLKTLMDDLDSYMETSEAFLQSELTIVDLAEKLNVHPKKISTVSTQSQVKTLIPMLISSHKKSRRHINQKDFNKF